MTINSELQKASLPALIELFEIDCNPCGLNEIFLLAPHTDANNDNIIFGGKTYMAFPIDGSGWEVRSDGSPPQPTLSVSNITQFLQPYLTQYQGLVGARVLRYMTFDIYLDNGATPDGTQIFGQQFYEIGQVSRLTKHAVDFKLQTLIDIPNRKIPKQQVLRTKFPGAGLFRKD